MLHTFCTSAGVRTCEISHIRTFTHISKNVFCKKNSGSHTMHVAHVSHVCGSVDVRNFAHSHFRTHFQKKIGGKKLWQPHHTRYTHFARLQAKFCTSALSHTFPIFFCKQTPAASPERKLHISHLRAEVRNFAHPHFSHIFPQFLQTNSSGHTCMHILFTHAHNGKQTPACTLNIFRMCAGGLAAGVCLQKFVYFLQQPHLQAYCTHLAHLRTCQISHIHIFTIFCKQTPSFNHIQAIL